MSGKAILNYTTTIEASKTLGEIMGMLARAGAQSLQVDYDQGQPVGIQFLIATKFGDRGFVLPANVDGVWKALCRQYEDGRVQRRFTTKEQAARVAWRIVRDWLDAQLAIIEAGLAELEQVMLPYMLGDRGQTLYQLMVEKRLALPSPREEGLGERDDDGGSAQGSKRDACRDNPTAETSRSQLDGQGHQPQGGPDPG